MKYPSIQKFIWLFTHGTIDRRIKHEHDVCAVTYLGVGRGQGLHFWRMAILTGDFFGIKS